MLESFDMSDMTIAAALRSFSRLNQMSKMSSFIIVSVWFHRVVLSCARPASNYGKSFITFKCVPAHTSGIWLGRAVEHVCNAHMVVIMLYNMVGMHLLFMAQLFVAIFL